MKHGQDGGAANIFDMPGDKRFKGVRAALVSAFSSYDNHEHHFSLADMGQMLRIGSAIARIDACKGIVSLPRTKLEMLAFINRLAEGLAIGQELHIFAPVCPDYGKGSEFYSTMGRSISPEANSAINAIRALVPILSDAGFGYSLPFFVNMLVADTEADLKEIIQRCAKGDRGAYRAACEGSAGEIRKQLQGVTGFRVFTFTGFLARPSQRDSIPTNI